MIALLIFISSLISFFSNKKGLSLFLLAFLISGGFWILGSYVTLFGYSIQLSDYALLYIAIIITHKIFNGKLKKIPKQIKSVNYFLIFILISISVDIVFNETPINDVFRTSRHWFFLLFVYLLPFFSKKDIIFALKLILAITFFELILFLAGPIVGKVFLAPKGIIEALSLKNVSRYALMPPFLFFLFVWVFSNKKYNGLFRYSVLSLIILAIIFSLTRSLIIAILLVFILSIFISKTKNSIKKIGVVLGAILIIFSISLYKPISERFYESIKDLSSLNNKNNIVEGNLSFRFLLFMERLDYILETPQTSVFGIGFVTEKNYKENNFNFGLFNVDDEKTQLDTGDIAWALFVIRLGLVGTLLYVIIYIKLLRYFFKNRKSYFALVGFYYLVIYFFLSLSGTSLYHGTFIFIPILFFQLERYDKIKVLLR